MKNSNELHDETRAKLLGDDPNAPVYVYKLPGTAKLALGASILFNIVLAAWSISYNLAKVVPDKTLYGMIQISSSFLGSKAYCNDSWPDVECAYYLDV